MTNKEEYIKEILQKHQFAGKNLEVNIPRHNRIFLNVQRTELKKIVGIIAKELNVQIFSTITARDTGIDLEVSYHFFIDGVVVTVRTSCPKDDPTVDSIVDIFPGAVLYEREIHDLLGIVPKKHPNLQRLVLPEDWAGGYPLRKDWKQAGGETDGQS